MKKQLSKKTAIQIFDSKIWEHWTFEEIVKVQLFQSRLCMPFDRFHEATGKVLGRPVWTHDFAYAGSLRKEYLVKHSMPTFDDLIELIQRDKSILIVWEEACLKC